MNYKTAGVDLEAAEKAKSRIAELVRKTHGPSVLHGPGLFGGFFQFPVQNYREPVLVSSVDGIGTKIKLACQVGSYRGLGLDIVNHCLNDLMVGGADPLFFLDYLAFGRLDAEVVAELIAGMAEACEAASCALIGGETAEMPDLYQSGEFDLAGTIVGVVEKDRMIDGRAISAGDVLIGLASSGLHTNGYTLARKIIAANSALALESYSPELGETMGAALLRPHRSFQNAMRALRTHPGITGFAHVTGGGIVGNTRRLLRAGLDLEIDWRAWEWPMIFKLLQQHSRVPGDEMQRVFNLGIGLVIVAKEAFADEVQNLLASLGEKSWRIGRVIAC
jgi:phosphoribosylformylglycinamidine cyclo-ligase